MPLCSSARRVNALPFLALSRYCPVLRVRGSARLSRSLLVGDLPLTISLRFLPTDGQTGIHGSPLRRQRCMSPKSTSITRGSAQCHEPPLQPGRGCTLEVRTPAVHSRCSRNRQPSASDAHPCPILCARRCRLTTQSESQTSCTLPLVLHQPMRTVRLRPART